jgi:hypothetical protein
MSTPQPGQIRCPTCHRSTAPAAFCTQCGTAIPDSARARPRGLDREELQDRIRTHRPGDAAFRRGSQVGGGFDQGPSAYRPYQPEPEDELVIPGAADDEGAAARVDNTPADFDEPPPPVVAPPPAPIDTAPAQAAPVEPPPVTAPSPAPVAAAKPASPPPPPPPPIVPVAAPAPRWSAPDEPYAAVEPDLPDYRYPDPGDEWERRGSGISLLAIGGFVLLGVLAIGVGAFMAGLFSGGVAAESPSPTPLVSTAPSATVEPSLAPSTAPSVPASLGPTVSPTTVPDGFTAQTEPCAEQPASPDGCGSSGATVDGGSVWVWVGWRNGTDADTLGVAIVDAAGATVGTGTFPLSRLASCADGCNGWARFKFGGLDPGEYTIRVDRNGAKVAEATFTVNS